MAKKGKKVILLSEDKTRNCPRHKIIPLLLNELNRCSVGDDDITAIVARGTRTRLTEKEFEEELGGL
jgi:nickel-dependent lactate racemase